MRLEEQILVMLKNNRYGWVSKDKLIYQLGISQLDINVQLAMLRNRGYKIEEHPEKGYKLIETPDLMLPAEIRYGLHTSLFGTHIFYYRTVDSTNDIAMRLANENANEGTIVICEEQTAGRGRLGRKWYSSPGAGIWVSLILRPKILPIRVHQISLCGAVVVTSAIRTMTDLPALIKWPNDVLINGKKVCGILTELNSELDKIRFVVIGIGINVNQTIEDFPNEIKHLATSLRIETGKKVSRVSLLHRVLELFEQKYQDIQQNRIDEIIYEWRGYSDTIGRHVTVHTPTEDIIGYSLGIDDEGALIIRTQDKGIRHIFSGDLSYD